MSATVTEARPVSIKIIHSNSVPKAEGLDPSKKRNKTSVGISPHGVTFAMKF